MAAEASFSTEMDSISFGASWSKAPLSCGTPSMTKSGSAPKLRTWIVAPDPGRPSAWRNERPGSLPESMALVVALCTRSRSLSPTDATAPVIEARFCAP